MKTSPAVSHRDLNVWHRGIELVAAVYALSRAFPRDERFGLTSQIRRAAVSIPSNVGEGWHRRSIAEKRHFVTIAQGSVAEVDTQLEIAVQLRFVEADEIAGATELLDHVGRMLTRMYHSYDGK